MIYITAASLDEHLGVFRHIAKNTQCNIAFWLYPTSGAAEIIGIQVVRSNGTLEQITRYDDYLPNHTRPQPYTESIERQITAQRHNIMAHVDSIALYPVREPNWLACIIDHEKTSLIRDESFLDYLVANGYNASISPPDGW